MGLVEYNGKWKRPEAVARDLKSDMARADLLAEYNGRRAKAAVTVAAQHKLALWCEEKGLKDEARAHLATVVRLDPNHADAWKRLGYKKVGQRWITEAQAGAEKVEHLAQQRADKEWKHKLERIRDAMASKVKRAEAERDLASITDARAVPSVMNVFTAQEAYQVSAVQVLGQIDAASSSRALVTLAFHAGSDNARRRAIETLRRRDPREWADIPIGLVRQKIRHEVKHVGGPGKPGAIYVEGKKANIKRIYRPADLPPLLPDDQIGYDAQGRVVIYRRGQTLVTAFTSAGQRDPVLLRAAYEYAVANPTTELDPLSFRTLGDVAKVTAIEADKVQPVFNLDVADDADFFAGPAAALVHDNSLPDLRLAPFDAPAIARLK